MKRVLSITALMLLVGCSYPYEFYTTSGVIISHNQTTETTLMPIAMGKSVGLMPRTSTKCVYEVDVDGEIRAIKKSGYCDLPKGENVTLDVMVLKETGEPVEYSIK